MTITEKEELCGSVEMVLSARLRIHLLMGEKQIGRKLSGNYQKITIK